MTCFISVPKSQRHLFSEITRCLSVAETQGFETYHIDVTQNDWDGVIISTIDGETLLTTDIEFDPSTNGVVQASCDQAVKLHYRSSIQLEDCAGMTFSDIYIGIKDNGNVYDVWIHPIDKQIRALSCNEGIIDNCHHFAWVIVALTIGFPIEDALTLARAFTSVSRETVDLGCWVNNFLDYPVPVIENKKLGIVMSPADSESPQKADLSFPEISPSSLGLYPVVDNTHWIEKLISLGVKTIQLRIKRVDQWDLERQIFNAVKLGRKYNAQVFINDYWQLAIKHGAYGVHLGQEDIELSDLAQIQNAGLRIGLSTHGYFELLRIVQLNPSYIALGHIFPTTTKEMPSKPQGLVRLKLYQKLVDTIVRSRSNCEISQRFPTVAIGGVDTTNAHQVWGCGVSSLAVVRAITLAESPNQVIHYFNKLMRLDSID